VHQDLVVNSKVLMKKS